MRARISRRPLIDLRPLYELHQTLFTTVHHSEKPFCRHVWTPLRISLHAALCSSHCELPFVEDREQDFFFSGAGWDRAANGQLKRTVHTSTNTVLWTEPTCDTEQPWLYNFLRIKQSGKSQWPAYMFYIIRCHVVGTWHGKYANQYDLRS